MWIEMNNNHLPITIYRGAVAGVIVVDVREVGEQHQASDIVQIKLGGNGAI